MKKNDSLGSLVWLGFAILICVGSIRLPLGTWRDPGPGFLPLGSGIFLGGLSLVYYVQTRLRKLPAFQEPLFTKEGRKTLLLLLIILFSYAIGLVILGFLSSTFLFLLLLSRIIKPRKWLVAAGGSAIASLAAYFIFEFWLRVPLPKGFWRF